MIREKPTLFSAAQSISDVAIAPDCEIRAIFPGLAAICAKLALSFAGGTINPTVFGPMMRISEGLAASSIAWRKPFAWLSPAVMTTAARVPFPASSRTMSGTVSGGVTITARSGTPGRSATVL